MTNTLNYEIIDDLIQFSNTMFELYMKLAELEYNNLTNSTEYQETIELIKDIINIEDKRYAKIKKMTPETQKDYRRYIIQKYELDISETLIDNIMDGLEELYPVRRAILYIDDIITKKDIDNDPNYEDRDYEITGMDIVTAVNQTVEMLLIKNIDKIAKSESYEDLKAQLIREKYGAIYIKKNFERKMIYYNFDLSKINGIYSSNDLKFNDIDEANYLLYLSETGKIYMKDEIELLLKINDNYYKENQGIRDAKMTLALLNVAIEMTEDQEYLETINYTYHQLIEEPEYINKPIPSKNSEELISKAIKEKRLKYR